MVRFTRGHSTLNCRPLSAIVNRKQLTLAPYHMQNAFKRQADTG